MLNIEEKLKAHYEKIGKANDDRVTAFDYNLRNLEIETAKKYLYNDLKLLDVGSGPGVACFEYARLCKQVKGCDYSQSMVEFATRTLGEKYPDLNSKVQFNYGSALSLPYDDQTFDVITSHRVLIAILSWEDQQKALLEIMRCLKSGGKYIMFEACEEGLKILNRYRKMFSLDIISEGGKGDYDRLLFSEKKLFPFMAEHSELVNIHHFGMYYFLTRILQPLFVSPEKPRYDHKLNDVAFEIAKQIPDFEMIGHLKGYVWEKIG
jgi:ubiquinone/menaquinone biosynthesis C-methylase UbiE